MTGDVKGWGIKMLDIDLIYLSIHLVSAQNGKMSFKPSCGFNGVFRLN